MPQVKKKSFIQKNGLIAVWTMAGFIAVGYIGFLVTGADGQRTGAMRTARLAHSGPVNREVADLKAHVLELSDRESKLAKKLSNIEQSLGPMTAALPDQPSETAQPSGYGIDDSPPLAARDEIPQIKLTKAVSIKVVPLTEDDNITEFSNPDQIENYGLDLASARSVDALERHWDYLQKTHKDLFEGLEAHFIGKGTSELPLYLLVAGPIDHMSQARKLCKKLSKLSIDCSETRFDSKAGKTMLTAGK